MMARALEALLRGGGSRRRTLLLCGLLVLVLAGLVLANLPAIAGAVSEMAAYLQYQFIQRALIVGVMVALCAALLGVILVLKQYSMIGDGLSHVGFGALTVAVSLSSVTAGALPEVLPETVRRGIAGLCAAISGAPLVFTLAVVVVCATLLLRISQNSRIRGDSAIALISTSALAVGVIVTSTTSGMNIDVYNYMFGSILAMEASDVALSIGLSIVVLAVFVALYPKIFAVTFDENFARATGMNTELYNLMIAVLTAVTIVVGMRIMGTMLISSLIIFPALTSMRVFSCFRYVVISSAIVSVVCLAAGIMLSCLWSLPAGAGIVAVNLVAFLIFSLIGAVRGGFGKN